MRTVVEIPSALEWSSVGCLSGDVRIATVTDVRPNPCSVRRWSLAVDLEAEAALNMRVYRAAGRPYLLAGAAGRAVLRLDIAKNPL